MFVAGQDQRVGNRTVPREIDKVRDDQRIHPFPLSPAVDHAEAELGIG